jgi:hypothetical protein
MIVAFTSVSSVSIVGWASLTRSRSDAPIAILVTGINQRSVPEADLESANETF